MEYGLALDHSVCRDGTLASQDRCHWTSCPVATVFGRT